MVSVDKASAPTITRFLTKPQAKPGVTIANTSKTATAAVGAASYQRTDAGDRNQASTTITNSSTHHKSSLPPPQQQMPAATLIQHQTVDSEGGMHHDVPLSTDIPSSETCNTDIQPLEQTTGTHAVPVVGQQNTVADRQYEAVGRLEDRVVALQSSHDPAHPFVSKGSAHHHKNSDQYHDDDCEVVLLSSPKRQKRCEMNAQSTQQGAADVHDNADIVHDDDPGVRSLHDRHGGPSVTHKTGMKLTSLFDQLTSDAL